MHDREAQPTTPFSAVDPETWRQIRFNPWSRLVASIIGGQLTDLGARYGFCGVLDDGTREVSWVLPSGQHGAPRGRRRVLLFRSLGGDRDTWEVVLREESCPRIDLEAILERIGVDDRLIDLVQSWPGRPVKHYNSLSRRGCVDDLGTLTGDLIADGLAHHRRPVADCGCR